MLSQLRQSMADGRLALIEPDGSPRHVSLCEQRLQRYEQIEVNASQFIHMTNDNYDEM
ncbi:hypothetical protein NTCA1_49450 [Novosphingobium sp. TCA1]|nr:hypothetical protein NTCA1_49450 [Novosphingobium sp. TCA1]